MRVIPSFTVAEGVSPSLCLTPESPFEWELLGDLPSLPGRLALLLPGGETSGLLSRSAWVAGLFPVCFLLLATMISNRGRGLRQPSESPSGASWARQPHSGSYLVLGSAPWLPERCFHWLLASLWKPYEAPPPAARKAVLRPASGGNHGDRATLVKYERFQVPFACHELPWLLLNT